MNEQEFEQEFNRQLNSQYSDLEQELNQTVNIGVVGSVSVGKSSFLNAFFDIKKGENSLFQVGAISGVTTKPKIVDYKGDVKVIDLPGLNDINDENSQETKNFLKNIDIGILIVTGSVDLSQKDNYNILKSYCDKIFVVINKVDEYDTKPKALEKVITQWKEVLGLSPNDKIWETCCDGYDPDDESDENRIRGIDELRQAVEDSLKEGKALKLKRAIKGKSEAAKSAVIFGTIMAVIAALVPGPSAIGIVVVQVIAIGRIHYIYTNSIISKTSILTIIPIFAGQSVAGSLFLSIKSLIPIPTGVIEVAAAVTALMITLPMLLTVSFLYAEGYTIATLNNEKIKDTYKKFTHKIKSSGIKERLEREGKSVMIDAITTLDTTPVKNLVRKILNDVLK